MDVFYHIHLHIPIRIFFLLLLYLFSFIFFNSSISSSFYTLLSSYTSFFSSLFIFFSPPLWDPSHPENSACWYPSYDGSFFSEILNVLTLLILKVQRSLLLDVFLSLPPSRFLSFLGRTDSKLAWKKEEEEEAKAEEEDLNSEQEHDRGWKKEKKTEGMGTKRNEEGEGSLHNVCNICVILCYCAPLFFILDTLIHNDVPLHFIHSTLIHNELSEWSHE